MQIKGLTTESWDSHAENTLPWPTCDKKKDLLGLLSFVPPIYHSFYHRLVDQESDSTESGDCSGED